MKKMLLVTIALAGLISYSCATDGYNTQRGAAIGAVGGALLGQVIGGNTAGTLIGAASGALVGGLAGNAADQEQTQQRLDRLESTGPVAVAPPSPNDAPPGEWVEVPGKWVNGKWVPAHRAWVPVNPGPEPPRSGQIIEPSGPQPYTFNAPPTVVPVPNSYVYFVPDIDFDILFYQGYWYRPHRGLWYRARFYNGPWLHHDVRRVPRAVTVLPPDYRRGPRYFHPVPHSDLERNWQRWERERRWDHRPGPR